MRRLCMSTGSHIELNIFLSPCAFNNNNIVACNRFIICIKRQVTMYMKSLILQPRQRGREKIAYLHCSSEETARIGHRFDGQCSLQLQMYCILIDAFTRVLFPALSFSLSLSLYCLVPYMTMKKQVTERQRSRPAEKSIDYASRTIATVSLAASICSINRQSLWPVNRLSKEREREGCHWQS